MNDDNGGRGGGFGGTMIFVGILILVNALSYFLNWGFWLF